jgi:diaminopimelate decarboxylase
VTAGVEAHTHEYIATAHEDQKFGFSITSATRSRPYAGVLAAPGAGAARPALHIGSQIFDTSGFEVAARRVLGLHARSPRARVTLPELDLGGGFGIAYTTQDDPATPAELATEMPRSSSTSAARSASTVPRLSIEPGRAIVGPAMCTGLQVGTVKPVRSTAARAPTSPSTAA